MYYTGKLTCEIELIDIHVWINMGNWFGGVRNYLGSLYFPLNCSVNLKQLKNYYLLIKESLSFLTSKVRSWIRSQNEIMFLEVEVNFFHYFISQSIYLMIFICPCHVAFSGCGCSGKEWCTQKIKKFSLSSLLGDLLNKTLGKSHFDVY